MVDTVTSQTIVDGDRNVVMKFTNVSDGSGEAVVVKVNVSALNPDSRGQTCTEVAIDKIHWHTAGMPVELLWDATANIHIKQLGFNGAEDSGTIDYTKFGGLINNAGAGVTGDLLFTVPAAAATALDTYDITLEMRKKYN